MTKQLILLISFLFISCSANDKDENNSSTIKKETLLLTTKDDNSTKIYTDYNKAFSIAKKEDKAIFILFYTQHCRWCSKLKETTLQDPKVISRLNKEFIVLYLDRDNSLYPNRYKVKNIPTVYMTDKNEKILTSIVGYHKNPRDYIKWFNYVKIELED